MEEANQEFKLDKRTKKILIVIVLLFAILFFWKAGKTFFNLYYTKDAYIEDIKSLEIQGLVTEVDSVRVKRFYAESEHQYYYEQRLHVDGEYFTVPSVWKNKFVVGDSLSKKEGEMIVYFYREGNLIVYLDYELFVDKHRSFSEDMEKLKQKLFGK